jgi:choline dehydrogenase
MQVSTPTATDQLWEACFDAAIEAGYAFNPDGNSGDAGGTSWNEANVVDGVRQSAADGYLTPIEDRTDLTIVTEAHAEQLMFDRTTCTGVEYRPASRVRGPRRR